MRRKFRALQFPAIAKIKWHFLNATRSIATSTERQAVGLGCVRRIKATKESHSRLLSDKDVIYALETHNVRPDSVDKYLINYEENVNLIQSREPKISCELVGSWMVEVGDLDQVLHLWKYDNGGYERVDHVQAVLSKDEPYQTLVKERGKFLRSRHVQYLLAFSFWPMHTNRVGNNKYEIRSYTLQAGTMIEWGNNWVKAINYRRKNDEPFGGYFSQVGQLYDVHHIWCYKDLQTRRETREAAWRNPGWDQCVAYTVPLIREVQSRILTPTSFSPTQ